MGWAYLERNCEGVRLVKKVWMDGKCRTKDLAPNRICFASVSRSSRESGSDLPHPFVLDSSDSRRVETFLAKSLMSSLSCSIPDNSLSLDR